MKKKTIFITILDILILICLFIFYGPFTNFRNLIISTAMVTKTHQYIAYTFYSENTIKEVMLSGSYIPINDTTNLDKIVIDTAPRKFYDNEYDKAVLTRDENNEDYKYLKIKVGKYDAHLVAIYDPSKVKLLASKSFNTTVRKSGSETVLKMCSRLGAIVGINGGGFADPDGWGSDIPMGYLIKDGKIIWSDSTGTGNLIGFTKDNKLLLVNTTGQKAIAMGMREALEFGPFLIVNGNKIQFNSTVGGYDRAARVAIGQRKDGVVLFLVTEGTHMNGPTMSEVVEALDKYGAYNAANLDGGSSTQLVIKGTLINNPISSLGQKVVGGRLIVSGFGLIP